MMKNNKGFTLIELIVVIAIIGILAAVAVPAFLNVVDQAHQANIDAVAGVMNSAIVLAASDSLVNKGYWKLPTALQATTAGLTTQLSGDWSDDGGGVWRYLAGSIDGTITYTPDSPVAGEFTVVSDYGAAN